MKHVMTTTPAHPHVFLAPSHERSERKTWAVIWLCAVMMVAEIVGGTLFGSVALVADGLHMSTHAGALLIAALAYTYARRHATDTRFSFGTGKLGDLAGFTSAIVLAMIALLIGYEAISRLFNPVAIDFAQAIPVAVVGLAVNIASAWLLSGGGHAHHHGHGHHHSSGAEAVAVAVAVAGAGIGHEDDVRYIDTAWGSVSLEVFEDGVPPRFRLRSAAFGTTESAAQWQGTIVETERPDGSRHLFQFADRGSFLESFDEIAEPHEFVARLRLSREGQHEEYVLDFEEHDHAHQVMEMRTHRDNNFRAALVHVMADAAVSVLVIGGLVLAKVFGWLWIDPVVGLLGAVVIASWAFGLIRDTGSILLDMSADGPLAGKIRDAMEVNGDRLADLHLWRLGPGHLGAIVSIATDTPREDAYYRNKLRKFPALSHLTLEVRPH
jgi:Co/Zn/Cd efflux system component